MTQSPPPAAGIRPHWMALPVRVRTAIERWLGAAVVAADTQPAGFSPGVAARLQTAHGRRIFVKAVAPELNPDSPRIYRREARIAAALPAQAPVPHLLWLYDEGADGWVALVFEDIEGRNPAQPWRQEEFDRVLDALIALSVALTPAPIPLASATERFAKGFRLWRLLRDAPPPGLDDWSLRHLDALVALEEEAVAAVQGETLLHFDLRADNLIVTPERVYVVDWPWACVGAAWVDVIGFAPSVAMQGGPHPEELLARHPAARSADAGALTAAIAAIAGYFTWHALQPPPPGIPTIRAFQDAQGAVAREWLAQRTGWDT